MMGEVAMLWFRCKNNQECGYIPDMTRKQIRQLMADNKSASSQAKARRFIRNVAGFYFHKGDNLYFHCKYGDIPLWVKDSALVNSADYPIENVLECSQCYERKQNERLLQL